MNEQADHPDIEKIAADSDGVIDGIPVRETIREIFRNPDNGTPDDISKAGCLALALKSNEIGGVKKGYVVWNAWRNAYPPQRKRLPPVFDDMWLNYANFSKHDFQKKPIDFSFFDFGDGANFTDCEWERYADFYFARFGNETKFVRAKLGVRADFRVTNFGDDCNFSGLHCGHDALFEAATFGRGVDFSYSKFLERINFNGVNFGDGANFDESFWNGLVSFMGGFATGLNNRYAVPAIDQRTEKVLNQKPSTSFGLISFKGAKFLDRINFEDRKFTSSSNFQGCEFKFVPIFHGSELHQNTSFEGAVFPPASGSDEAARAYRTLKLAFSKQQGVRDEQRFFRLEMEEESVSHRLKATQAVKDKKRLIALREIGTWFLYKLYAWFSDYGFSVARPLLVLVVTWLIFAFIYGSYASGQTVCVILQAGCDWPWDWVGYSLQQALPLPGFDKLDHTIKGVAVGWLFLHKTISLAALFLIGLALRNLFKLK